jgi:hypothetical protein
VVPVDLEEKAPEEQEQAGAHAGQDEKDGAQEKVEALKEEKVAEEKKEEAHEEKEVEEKKEEAQEEEKKGAQDQEKLQEEDDCGDKAFEEVVAKRILTTELELSLQGMAEAGEQLEHDLDGFVVDPSEDEAQKCSESTSNAIEAWRKTNVIFEATAAALKEGMKEGDLIELKVESAIDVAKLARTVLVRLRFFVATLEKKKPILGRMGKGKALKTLKSVLEKVSGLLQCSNDPDP